MMDVVFALILTKGRIYMHIKIVFNKLPNYDPRFCLDFNSTELTYIAIIKLYWKFCVN